MPRGIQFHIESTVDTVASGARYPPCKASLEAALGASGAERLTGDVAVPIGRLNADARRINDAFMALAENPATEGAGL